jgi:hypothetical protein
MPLIDDVLDQLGKSTWLLPWTFNLGFGKFRRQMKIKKTAIIIKSGFYEWNVMPFRLKNVGSIFSRTMVEVFKDRNNQFFNVFVDDVNIHSVN